MEPELNLNLLESLCLEKPLSHRFHSEGSLTMESTRIVRRRGHHRIIEQRRGKAKGGPAKGTSFESHVIGLFPTDMFSVLHDTRRDSVAEKIPESALNPDFRLRHRPSKHVFWVECKFRSSARYGVISWSTGAPQFVRYKEFQERVRPEKVYVVIGLIGFSTKPKFMYCIPLDEITEPDLYVNEIRKYVRNPRGIFTYVQGRLC